MNFRKASLILAGAASIGFCVAPVYAHTQPSDAQLSEFLNQASKINQDEIAVGGQAADHAQNNLALKSFGSLLKADHQVNEDTLKQLASDKNINLTTNAGTPAADENLAHESGAQYGATLAEDEIKDHQEAIRKFQAAESEFKSDPNVEMYIKQTLPVLETHLKEAELLKQHEEQQTAHK